MVKERTYSTDSVAYDEYAKRRIKEIMVGNESDNVDDVLNPLIEQGYDPRLKMGVVLDNEIWM